MPRVQLSNTKGLFQKSGKGFEHIDSDSTTSVGFHRWVETVDISAAASGKVVGRVGMYIPAQARILFAVIGNQELAASAGTAIVRLDVHSADVALGGNVAGTEIIGASAAAALPVADLELASGGVLYDLLTTGTLAPIDRSTSASYFQIGSQSNMAAMTGSPKVTVVIEWYGLPAVAL
jgi:hypothetical protein